MPLSNIDLSQANGMNLGIRYQSLLLSEILLLKGFVKHKDGMA